MAAKVDSGTQKKRKPVKKHRSAKSGRYVGKSAAKASPATTVAETDGEAARLRAAIRAAVVALRQSPFPCYSGCECGSCVALNILRRAVRKKAAK